MEAKRLGPTGERTWILVFDEGDEAVSELTAFAREQGLSASHFTAIGAFRDAVVGWFDWDAKDYRRIPVAEQVEVLSLSGDVAEGQDGPKVHAHVVLGRSDGSTRGGHLLEGHVRPTLELVLTESPPHLARRQDPRSGLALIDLSRSSGALH